MLMDTSMVDTFIEAPGALTSFSFGLEASIQYKLCRSGKCFLVTLSPEFKTAGTPLHAFS